MKEQEIKEELKKKFDDEYTIKMFTNFVVEFQECFSDIMPAEQVIERIKKNIFGSIKIVEKFDNRELDGRYGEDGRIYLREDVIQNERYVKYLLFHEMLHSITSVRDENGTELMMGFSYLKYGYGKGLNEAMTEYLTQIRNEKFENNRSDLISGYRTIVEQMRRMTNIFGMEEILHYYFYEPYKFKDFINAKGMNYEEIELAFRGLFVKDDEVWNFCNGENLKDSSNYIISRYAKIIFNNYSKAIGEVSSLEKFENKYRIFQTCGDGNYDCINTMLIPYYNSIGKDVDNLLKMGVDLDKIEEVLDKLHISLDVLTNMYHISKLFGKDKNQTAIALYDFYMKNHSLYLNIFSQNYAYIYDYFRETDTCPGEELYDSFSYPLIGALLKEHSQIDFSEVSYYKIEEIESKMRCYLFYTDDSNMYVYTADGKSIKPSKDKEENDIYEIKMNEFCNCQLIRDKKGEISCEVNPTSDFDTENYKKHINFRNNHVYSEKSDIEYWIQENSESAPYLLEKLQKINNRIKSRQGISYGD